MLTAFDGDEDIHKALQAGAQGYVLKSSPGEKLLPALRAVAAGQRWIPNEVANRLASRSAFEQLTPREVQVLNHLAKGLAKQGDRRRFEHQRTHHQGSFESILAKLRVADRTEAVTRPFNAASFSCRRAVGSFTIGKGDSVEA